MGGVQTAIFGLLITLLNAGQLKLDSLLIKGAIVAFGFSIVCAGFVLGSVPWLLSRKSMPQSVQSAPIADWPLVKKISIGWVSGLQYLAFIIGLVSLVSAVIWKQIG